MLTKKKKLEFKNSHSTLIFGGNESSLKPRLKKKCIIQSNIREFMIINSIILPHFNVMFCNNSISKSVPLFIMIPYLDNSPIEIQPFIDFRSEILFYSGCLTSSIGLLNTVCA